MGYGPARRAIRFLICRLAQGSYCLRRQLREGQAVESLELDVVDYESPDRWRFVLREPGGAFVADHEVRLPIGDHEYEGFRDLHRYVRWHGDPADRLGSEATLVER